MTRTASRYVHLRVRLWALLVLLAVCCTATPELHGGRSNVLLIVVDTLRADHLGSWGYPVDTSPNLDMLAADGVRFSSFYSNSSWTRPGMASLITGQYPRTTGIYEERYDALPEDLTTLAELLRPRGYLTLGVTANPNINTWFGFDQGMDEYLDSGVVWTWMAEQSGGTPRERGSAELDQASVTTGRALSLLDRHAATLTDRPFYLHVLYIDPHLPHLAPEAAVAAVAESPHQGYDAEIRYTDAEIRRLLDGIDERGYLEDTLVIVTADHGEGLDDHPGVPLSRRHGDTLYDSVLHVPLIFWHPALEPRVVDTLASSIDLVPTVLELLGWPLAEGQVAGRSVAPLVRGEAAPVSLPRHVIAETDWRAASKVSVRSAQHRYVRNDDVRAFQSEGVYEGRTLSEERRSFLGLPADELYRLEVGVREHPQQRERGEDAEAPRARLEATLADWEAATLARPPLRRSADDVFTFGDGRVVPAADSSLEVRIPPGLEEGLRALGYLEEDD